jgi:hypothetical protein
MQTPGTAGCFKSMVQSPVATVALKTLSFRDAMQLASETPAYREVMGLPPCRRRRPDAEAPASPRRRSPRRNRPSNTVRRQPGEPSNLDRTRPCPARRHRPAAPRNRLSPAVAQTTTAHRPPRSAPVSDAPSAGRRPSFGGPPNPVPTGRSRPVATRRRPRTTAARPRLNKDVIGPSIAPRRNRSRAGNVTLPTVTAHRDTSAVETPAKPLWRSAYARSAPSSALSRSTGLFPTETAFPARQGRHAPRPNGRFDSARPVFFNSRPTKDLHQPPPAICA